MEPITVAPGDEAASYVEQNAMSVVSEAIDRLLTDQPAVGTEVAVFESHLRSMNPKRRYRERVLTLPKLPPPKPKKEGSTTPSNRRGSSQREGSSPPDTAETKGLVSPRVPSSASTATATPPPAAQPPSLPNFFLPTKNSKGNFAIVATEIPTDMAAPFGTPRKTEIKAFPSQFTLKFTAVESGGAGASASVQLQRRQEQEALRRMGLDTDALGPAPNAPVPRHRTSQVLHQPPINLRVGGDASAQKVPAIILGDPTPRGPPQPRKNSDVMSLNLLERCKELPIFIGDYPWNAKQVDLMIQQLTQVHEMRHITFIVATTPSVAVRLDDGFMYRADVDTALWNLAARQLVEDILSAQSETIRQSKNGGEASATEEALQDANVDPVAAAAQKAKTLIDEAAAADAEKRTLLGLSPQTFGEHLHSERAAVEKAADILLDLGVDPKLLGDAEYEELDRARRVDNARRRSGAKGGASKFRTLVHGVMENRKRTREQLSLKMKVPKSRADALLSGESINANSLLHAIDDEKLENALIKFLFPSYNKDAGDMRATRDSIMSSLDRGGLNRSKFSQISPTKLASHERRSVSYSESGSTGVSPVNPTLSFNLDASNVRGERRRRDSRDNSITSLTLSPTTKEGSMLGRRGSNPFSTSATSAASPTHIISPPPPITLKSRSSTTFMAQALKRSKSFGLAETALRAARERRSETEVRASISVSSSLMVLRDAARDFVHRNRESEAVFHYHRIFHSTSTPMSQRATDKIFEILSHVPKVHDSCVVILGFNQSVLLRHIATISSIYFKIVREVQSVNHAFTLYDVQERINPHVDVDAQRRRVLKGRNERDQRRAIIADQIRPKMRAIEQVESPAECRERLKRAAKDRQERLERRHRVDEALDNVDFSQQYLAAVKIQSRIRGYLGRRRVEDLLDSSTEAYVSADQILFKEFREGKSLFIQQCVQYLVDALGPEMVAEKTPSRSFTRTLALNTRRKQRVLPVNEDDISSEDEQWVASTVRHVVPGNACSLNPVANVIAALQAAGSDDVSFLVEVISEYSHVEPMQRKASSILEKLVMYVMFAAFAAMRIKLDFGYAATPGSYASTIFLQIPTRFQPVGTFSEWMTALPLPLDWARQMSILSHANSRNPHPILGHRVLLGGPLPNGAWIADEPAEENPAVAAAAIKAAKDTEKSVNEHSGPTFLRNPSMFLGPNQSFRGLPTKRGTMQPSRDPGTPSTGPRKEDYVIVCPRRVEKFDRETDPAISVPLFLVPECLTDVQWEETVQGLLSGEAIKNNNGGNPLAARGYNRVVWISTSAHPCVVVNGVPMYVPERKSTLQRHCINNPIVKDSKTDSFDFPEEQCENVSLSSYAPPTGVPEPRAIHSGHRNNQNVSSSSSKKGNRSLLLLSEMPLLTLGVTKSELAHALPPRHLTTMRDEVNNQVSALKKPQFVYLAEIEAAIIEGLVKQLASTNGIIEYHPTSSLPQLTMFKPYWELPMENGQQFHTRVSVKDREKGTLDELSMLIGELGYEMIWGSTKGGEMPDLRHATLGVDETTSTYGLRKPTAARLRVAQPSLVSPATDPNITLARDTAERLAAPGILKAVPGRHNNAVAAAAAVAIGAPRDNSGVSNPATLTPISASLAVPNDPNMQPNRNLLALPRRSRKGGKQGTSPSGDALPLAESAAVAMGTTLNATPNLGPQPAAGSIRLSVLAAASRLPKNPSDAFTSLPAIAERIRTSVKRNPDADRDNAAFKYHRVPLKYGHMTELATCLSDIYEFIVANSDEPRTAFVFGISDPIKSVICSTAAAVVYELDLRKSYQRAEVTETPPPAAPASTDLSAAANGQTSGKKTGFLTPSQMALDPNIGSTTPSRAKTTSSKDIAQPAPLQQLPKRAPTKKPSALTMFPFLSRVSDENIGIELERACTTLNEIAVGCGVYDLLIGDAARTVLYAILCQLPDEESLAPPPRPDLEGSYLDPETNEDGTPVPLHVSIRRRREAEMYKKEAEEEERLRKKSLLMTLPQLRFTRRTLIEWLEALKPFNWMQPGADVNEGSSIVYAHKLYTAINYNNTPLGGNGAPHHQSASPTATVDATLSSPYGPLLSLEEASKRFEQYFTLALFTSFVRLSCDARRINAATGKLLPRFEDHVLGTTQLMESIKQGINMWEAPTQASDGVNEFDANGLLSARGNKRRNERDKRMNLTPAVMAATAAAAAAAIEGTNVTNCCVEDDPHSRNKRRPQNHEDMINLAAAASSTGAQSQSKMRGRSLPPHQQGSTTTGGMASVGSFASFRGGGYTNRSHVLSTNAATSTVNNASASIDMSALGMLDDSAFEPYEEPVHPLSTAAAALARPFTVFDAEYEGIRLWKKSQYAMHVLR